MTWIKSIRIVEEELGKMAPKIPEKPDCSVVRIERVKNGFVVINQHNSERFIAHDRKELVEILLSMGLLWK